MSEYSRRDVLRTALALPAVAVGDSVAGTASVGDFPKPRRYEEIAGYELDGELTASPLAILPLGSLEYHGPHNPFGTDSIIISGIAERVALRTRATLFPTTMFTQCPAHTAHFRGTISIRPEVMTMYFADILRGILRLGYQHVFVLNGHDGNIGPGRGAIAEVADEMKNTAILFASWWEFLPGEMMKSLMMFHQSNGGHGHGGPLETSAVAAFRPDLIHLDKSRDMPEPPDFSGGSPYFLQKSQANDWPGYSGKVSEASPEKGQKLVRMSEDAIVKLIENWLNHGDAPGSW